VSQDQKRSSENKSKRRPHSISFDDPDNPTRTHQSFRDECDINHIVRTANKNGRLPDLIKENPRYGDFSEPLTYQESLNTVIRANDQFAMLPSHTRAKFNNDPGQFLEFAANPENKPEMVKLGLAKKREIHNDSNDANLTNSEPVKTPKKQQKPDSETPPQKT